MVSNLKVYDLSCSRQQADQKIFNVNNSVFQFFPVKCVKGKETQTKQKEKN